MALVRTQVSYAYADPMDLDPSVEQGHLAVVPAKRKRATPIATMDEYKDEMKFYYLGLNYTVKEVRDAMESHYNFGASLIQYRERLNKWGFKKRGTKGQWEAIAKSVATRGNSKESEAILNGEILISSTKLKKEIARKFTLSELARMKHQTSRTEVAWPPSPTAKTVEVRSPMSSPVSWPIFTSWCVPRELLNSLPIRISDPKIIKICETTFLRYYGRKPEERLIIRSRSFKDLRLLLYRLSNRLLDFKIINGVLERLKAEDGYRTLKELISLDTISVKAACSGLLLMFAIRLEPQLIRLIYHHHPTLTSTWIHKLNLVIHQPVLEAGRPGFDVGGLEEVSFLQDLRREKHFPAWNANSLRFLRSCFRDAHDTSKLKPVTVVAVQAQFWSLDPRSEMSPLDRGPASTPTGGRAYILTRSLRFDCGISINLRILRALLLGQVRDAGVLLPSVIHIPPELHQRTIGLMISDQRELRYWFWTHLARFLDAYLTAEHICKFLCGLVFMDQPNLTGLVLQYIQQRRTRSEKKYIEACIQEVAFSEEWKGGSFTIYAAKNFIINSKTPVEDSLTIFWTPKFESQSAKTRAKNLGAFGNFLNSSSTFTHIYLQDRMQHLLIGPAKYKKVGRCSNRNPGSPDGFTFRVGWHICNMNADVADQLADLPILTLNGGRKILIPLLSPWEEDGTVFDSLFWVSAKSCYQTCSNCSCKCNVNLDLSPYGLAFSLYTVRMLMCEILSGGLHDIKRIDGRITLWDSAGRVPSDNNKSRFPPHRSQSPTCSPGPGFQEIFESFDWGEAFRVGANRAFIMPARQYNNEITYAEDDILFRKSLPYRDWETTKRVVSQGWRGSSSTEYAFDILEYHAYGTSDLPQHIIKWIELLIRKLGTDVNYRSNENGLIPNHRRGRTLLQVTSDWFNSTGILQVLIDQGAAVNSPGTGDFGTALQSCCRRPTALKSPGVTRLNTVRLLVESGADVNPRNPDNTRPRYTPLDGAVLAGDIAVARYLLEKGACIDLETIKYAVNYGRLDMVSLFVQFDARFHGPALDFAKLSGEEVIQEYLEGPYLGQGPLGVPSEFIMFSRLDELDV
ncbi:hypothetical protein TWF481_010153 [Arthrobotrys musiformis]|uniref:Clr5 domain-containing protein n=1 Tax=Arthrobotrys musiformis TaxID=47236 RepID=A0AAV9W006_9PEZI